MHADHLSEKSTGESNSHYPSRYVKFASAAYGFAITALTGGLSFGDLTGELTDDIPNDEGVIMRLTGCSRDDILRIQNEPKVERPCYIVVRDVDKIVIAIRGTASVSDIITDLNADSVPFMGGKAHDGILGGADIIYREIRKLLSTELPLISAAYEKSGIIVCGHSLGGGTALLLTLKLLKYMESSHCILPPNQDIKCLAFAPPPVITRLTEEQFPERWKNRFDVFVNYSDVVPTLSLHNVYNFFLEIEEIDNLYLTQSQRLKVLWDHIRDNEDETRMQQFLKVAGKALKRKKKNPYDKFELFGNIHWYSGEGLYQTTEQSFNRILLDKSMVTNHVVTAYGSALHSEFPTI